MFEIKPHVAVRIRSISTAATVSGYQGWLTPLSESYKKLLEIKQGAEFLILGQSYVGLNSKDKEHIHQFLLLVWCDEAFGGVGAGKIAQADVVGSRAEEIYLITRTIIRGLRDGQPIQALYQQIDLRTSGARRKAIVIRAISILSDLRYPSLFNEEDFWKFVRLLEIDETVQFPNFLAQLNEILGLYTSKDFIPSKLVDYILPWIIYENWPDTPEPELQSPSPSAFPLAGSTESHTATVSSINFWWLSMNPKHWGTEFRIGERCWTHDLNDDGTSRQMQEYLISAREGDLMVGYSEEPVQSVIVLFRIEKGLHNDQQLRGNVITFKVIDARFPGISLDEIRAIPSFTSGEPLGWLDRGKFLRLTPEQYNEIAKRFKPVTETPTQQGHAINISDAYSSDTPDHLDFYHDVDAFSKLVVYRDSPPPLAIGLFGHWGTGKSYFMEKLREQIDSYAGTNDAYCKNIVHVPFNSWHYSDANLWASLVTQIFDRLNAFASHKLNRKEITEQDVKELYANLQLTGQLLEETQSELNATTVEKQNVEEKLQRVQVEKTSKLNTLKGIRDNWDEVKAILNDPEIENDVTTIRNSLGEKTLSSLNTISAEVNKLNGGVNRIFKMGRILFKSGNGFLIMLLLAVVIALGCWLITKVYASEWSSLAQVVGKVTGTVSGILVAFGGALRPAWKKIDFAYNRLISLRDSWETIKSRVSQRKSEEENSLERQVAELGEKEEALSKVRSSYENKIKSLNEELTNIGSGMKLAEFIKSTSGSARYAQQLGIISWIRKDFEELDRLIRKQEEVAKRNKPEEKIKTSLQVDRIILYIDDLDRCPRERVVQVLEAVHLLLALPLFVVVVGVDPRWLSNSLDNKFDVELGSKRKRRKTNSQSQDVEYSASLDYLEKIFQVPFALREMHQDGVKKIISHYLVDAVEERKRKQLSVADNSDHLEPGTSTATTPNTTKPNTGNTNDPTKEPKTENQIPPSELKPVPSFDPQLMEISEEEIDFMKEIAGIIGHTPRSVKRYLNIYRLVKSHHDVVSVGYDIQRSKLVMIILALITGQGIQIVNLRTKLLSSDPITIRQLFKESTSDMPNNVREILDNSLLSALMNEPVRNHEKLLQLVIRFSFKPVTE